MKIPTKFQFGRVKIDTAGLTAQGVANALRCAVETLADDLADCVATGDMAGVARCANAVRRAANETAAWKLEASRPAPEVVHEETWIDGRKAFTVVRKVSP